MPNLTQAFHKNLSIIIEELQLADTWGKASIIFTVHKDIFSQAKTKQALTKKLEDFGFQFIEVESDRVGGNLIEYLLHFQHNEHTVFFISNLDWGGGESNRDLYRILNLHRETLIEQKMKVVLFLNLNEASKLPHYAPDFWAFRHRALEFATSSARNKRKPPVGMMRWQLEHTTVQGLHPESKISQLKKVLNEIPDQPEAKVLRTDLQLELGYMSWQEGDLAGAEETLRKGLDSASTHSFNLARAKFMNGLAIIAYERADYQKALALLETVVRENPRDCAFLMNQAISLFASNKRSIALQKGLNATTLCAPNAWLEYSLGFLYYFAGKINDAITHFQNAVDRSPGTAPFHEALIICYLALGLHHTANDEFLQVKEWLFERKIYHDLLKACVAEREERALSLIQEAIRVGELADKDVVREPTLYALFAAQNPLCSTPFF